MRIDALLGAFENSKTGIAHGSTTMATSEHLRAIVFPDAGLYVAQCLEHDIVAQAETAPAAFARLELTIEAEMAMREIDHLNGEIAPAPTYYIELWDKAETKIERVTVDIHKCTPRIEGRLSEAA